MKFGSVCSGIEAASVAWHPLGWEAAWLAEVDRAASEVLATRFPHVSNHGDMTLLPGKVDRREIVAPDILVGGTPCQAFSVAGRREGLADARGQLTLAYVDLADAIDRVRRADGDEPCIIVWENVPGVLSSKDNAFGCFLAGLAGEDQPLEPPGKKWGNAGVVLGPERAIAWRIIDAQYVGLAQRRRRVFVVASAREGFDPAGILLEFEGVRRDSAPSREAGEGITHPTAPCLTSSGRGVERTGDTRGQDPVVAVIDDGVAGRLRGAAVGVDLQNIAETGDLVGTIDTGMARGNRGYGVLEPIACYGLTTEQTPKFNEDCALTLTKQSPSGGGQPQAVAYSVALRGRDGGATAELGDDVAGCSQASGGGADKPHVLAPVAYAIQERAVADTNCGPGGKGWRDDDCAFTLEARNKVQAVCVTGDVTHTLKAEGFDASEDGTGRGQPIVPASYATREVAQTITSNYGKQLDNSDTALGPNVAITDMAVRRLMPVECERLQGFPDGWTLVPNSRGKLAADGPRYKQLGNSMAVNVMAWIGRRIAASIRPCGHNGGPPLDDFDSLLADDFEALL